LLDEPMAEAAATGPNGCAALRAGRRFPMVLVEHDTMRCSHSPTAFRFDLRKNFGEWNPRRGQSLSTGNHPYPGEGMGRKQAVAKLLAGYAPAQATT
jgi:hypothetical protein